MLQSQMLEILILKQLLQDLLISASSMYIFPTNILSFTYNIKNRQFLVNMKAIGAVVMTESAFTFLLVGSW